MTSFAAQTGSAPPARVVAASASAPVTAIHQSRGNAGAFQVLGLLEDCLRRIELSFGRVQPRGACHCEQILVSHQQHHQFPRILQPKLCRSFIFSRRVDSVDGVEVQQCLIHIGVGIK